MTAPESPATPGGALGDLAEHMARTHASNVALVAIVTGTRITYEMLGRPCRPNRVIAVRKGIARRGCGGAADGQQCRVRRWPARRGQGRAGDSTPGPCAAAATNSRPGSNVSVRGGC